MDPDGDRVEKDIESTGVIGGHLGVECGATLHTASNSRFLRKFLFRQGVGSLVIANLKRESGRPWKGTGEL
jgi:hypothetical protein